MGCKLLEAAHHCNDTHGKSRKKENPAVVGKEPTMCVSTVMAIWGRLNCERGSKWGLGHS